MHFIHISLGLRTRERTVPNHHDGRGQRAHGAVFVMRRVCACAAWMQYHLDHACEAELVENMQVSCSRSRHQVKVVPVNQQVESNAQSARHGEAFSATPPTVRCQMVMLWTLVCLAAALRSPEPIFGPVGVRGRGASQWARRGAERSSETCCR